jgi:hypothetical protein
MSRYDAGMVPITAADMERFHRHAWAAVERREGSYAFDEFGAGLRSVILGGVPILGVLTWGWSPIELLVFLIVGSWAAIICDFAKLWYLEKQIRDWAAVSYDNWHVWTVVHALRNGNNEAPKSHLGAKYEPWAGVLIDFFVGGLATTLICIGLIRSPQGIVWSELNNRSMLLWLGGLISYQLLFTAWEIVDHRLNRARGRQVKVALGMRGLGLFILVFIIAASTDGFEQTGTGVQTAMLAVNAAIVLLGIGTMVGPLFIRRETAWLRDYLQERGANKKP